MVVNFSNYELYQKLRAFAFKSRRLNIKCVPSSLLRYPLPLSATNCDVPLKGVGPVVREHIKRLCEEGWETKPIERSTAHQLLQQLDAVLKNTPALATAKAKTDAQAHLSASAEAEAAQPKAPRKRKRKPVSTELEAENDLGLHLVVDAREHVNYPALSAYLGHLKMTVMQLALGDFLWCAVSEKLVRKRYKVSKTPASTAGAVEELDRLLQYNVVPTVVERKTFADLLQSVSDGRYSEQWFRLTRLKTAELASENLTKVIVLVEQCADKTQLNVALLQSCILSVAISPHVLYLFSEGIKTTATHLASLSTKLNMELQHKAAFYKPLSIEEYNQLCRKSNAGFEPLFQQQLLCIPGLSAVAVHEVLRLFSNFGDLAREVLQFQQSGMLLERIKVVDLACKKALKQLCLAID